LKPLKLCDIFPNSKLSNRAARLGRLEILKIFKENDFVFNEETCAKAAKGGHIHILEWLHNANCPWDVWTCVDAVRNGHFETVKWLFANKAPCEIVTYCSAAKHGHLEILKWLFDNTNGETWDYDILKQQACSGGHIVILEWICSLKNGEYNQWDADHCGRAAGSENPSALQWLRSKGVIWNYITVSYAAFCGNLQTLQWAVANGAPFRANEVLVGVLTAGHLDILQWFASHQGIQKWNLADWKIVSSCEHLHIMEWFLISAAGKLEPPEQELLINFVTSMEKTKALQWLNAHGFSKK
jgi:hypothetical protein